MKAHTASLFNAATLIVCSVWGFIAVSAAHWTPLIPGAFGIVLLICYPGVKEENKTVAHIAAVLTVLLLIALVLPLRSAIGSGEPGALLRSIAMFATTLFALIYFVKSFRDARRARG